MEGDGEDGNIPQDNSKEVPPPAPAFAGSPDPNDPWEDKDKYKEPPQEPSQSKIDEEAIQKSIEKALHGNKLIHVFENPEHRFNNLLEKLGGIECEEARRKLITMVVKEVAKSSSLPLEGQLAAIIVTVMGAKITVRVKMHEGIIRISTMFIPKPKNRVKL